MAWSKETFDEIQQLFYLVAAFGMWIMFEYWCFTNKEYAAATHTNGVRIVLINIVTNMFTYIYTKSRIKGG